MNLFKPIIKDSFNTTANKDQFLYNYDVTNHASSKQGIAFMLIKHARMVIKGLPAPRVPANPNDCTKEIGCDFTAYLAQGDVNRAKTNAVFDSYLKTPKGSHGTMSLSDPVSDGLSEEFGWFGIDLPVGKTIKGAGIVRPELPGVGIANMAGLTPDSSAPGRPEGFPSTGPLNTKMNALELSDTVYVPVLAPAVVIPAPYNGSTLAKDLRVEVNSWVNLGLAHQIVIDRLNRQLDVLIPALQTKNKLAARGAVTELYKEMFTHNPTLTVALFNLDADAYVAKPFLYKKSVAAKDQTPSLTPLNRVAARALGINLNYLITQLEAGK